MRGIYTCRLWCVWFLLSALTPVGCGGESAGVGVGDGADAAWAGDAASTGDLAAPGDTGGATDGAGARADGADAPHPPPGDAGDVTASDGGADPADAPAPDDGGAQGPDVPDGSAPGDTGPADSGGPRPDAGGAPADTAGAGDGGPLGTCEAARAPDRSVTLTAEEPVYWDDPRAFAAGDELFVTGPFDDYAYWYRWTGLVWAPEPIPWPAGREGGRVLRVIALVDGAVLLEALHGSEFAFFRFDGARLTEVATLPAAWGNPSGRQNAALAATQTSDGRFWVYAGPPLLAPGRLAWTDDGGDTWLEEEGLVAQDAEVGLVATGADRLVLASIGPSADPHVRVRHRGAGDLWSDAEDLTPTWTTQTLDLQLVAARDGGVVLAVDRDAPTLRLTSVWRSPDGVAWEALGVVAIDYRDTQADVLAPACLSEIVVLAPEHREYRPTLGRYVGGFLAYEPVFERPAEGGHETGSAAILPDGTMAYAYGWSNGAVTEFWLTMHATTRP